MIYVLFRTLDSKTVCAYSGRLSKGLRWWDTRY